MKRNVRSHILPVLAVLLATLTAQPAAADGAVLFKGGVIQLADDGQQADNRLISIDERSTHTFALAFEQRVRRNGMAFGIEYLSHRHDFSFPTGAEPGDIRTQILQFIVRKYFFERSVVRPFIGIGVGGGHTRIEYQSGGSTRGDDVVSFVLQGAAGVEFRIENLSLMLEIKRFWHEPGASDDFNATATGVYGGIGFNW